MKKIEIGGWIYYASENKKEVSANDSGKWMYFFENRAFVESVCIKAIKENAITVVKHTDGNDGVACFYLDRNDISGHKKIIKFFIDNNLICRTKSGRLYNIPFKLDSQTKNGDYGNNFVPKITLSDFIDLYTGEWKV